MFKNKRDAGDSIETGDASVPPPLPAPTTPSTISTDLTIKGNLDSEGEIRVDGTVEGDIECRQLHLGETGQIKGNVKAVSCFIAGRLQGEVDAGEVVISQSATMLGDVLHDSLTIEQGAHIDGRCSRRNSQQSALRLSGPAGITALDEARPARTNGKGDSEPAEATAG